MKASTALTAVISLFSTVKAHGAVDQYIVGDTTYAGWPKEYTTTVLNIRPVVYQRSLSETVSTCVKAKFLIQWTHRPTSFLVYMAKCPGTCDGWDGSGKVWFKVFEQGLISGTQNAGIWAGDAILDTLYATITIPATLAPGDYLIRHELIAVHQANNPQFYPECAQFTVTGSGTASPPLSILVSFPGAYAGTEPGIAFNIDSPDAMKATTYPIPGPPVWDGTGNAPAPQPTATSAPTTMVTSAVAVPTKPASPACEVVKYGQCGGMTYTGCTTCASGSTCKANGDYYSQCM
ncbi:glycoside hydrolase family 61 protein [Stemphylium lycopersici]|uniref:AA9 family lytic polysaccharide monooxygenase n=1 Tax=Stemphylium lycopersici TaxID=183478 RepID=A0A364NC44_STELY|nr:glycoside hydrolase family 61 protein [Stemphylium lycopersici]RAR14889.1 glycoside hydrolase family 61 protein [Stemphylium lycopersici]